MRARGQRNHHTATISRLRGHEADTVVQRIAARRVGETKPGCVRIDQVGLVADLRARLGTLVEPLPRASTDGGRS